MSFAHAMDLEPWACTNADIQHEGQYLICDDDMYGMHVIMPNIPDKPCDQAQNAALAAFEAATEPRMTFNGMPVALGVEAERGDVMNVQLHNSFEVEPEDEDDLPDDYEDIPVHGRKLWFEKPKVSTDIERYEDMPHNRNTRKPGRKCQHRKYRGRQWQRHNPAPMTRSQDELIFERMLITLMGMHESYSDPLTHLFNNVDNTNRVFLNETGLYQFYRALRSAA